MRHFRFAWPTVLAAIGCTTFTVALVWTQTATAANIERIYTTHSCSRETDDTTFFAYNNDYECGDNHECRDGDYYYQQKYGFLYAQPADRVARDVGMDADSEENEEDGYSYQYALPQDLYGSSVIPSLDIIEVEETVVEQPWGDMNQYMDDQYMGSPYILDYPSGFDTDESLALFTWDPAELLTWSDQEILRQLVTLQDQTPGVRRAVLSDYIESLGMEATDLSIRFEEISGLAVLSLSDDLPQTAAFMACFRLVERGELESDEALALLQRSLLHRSDRWNCWIDEITTERVTSNPMLKAVVLTAASSLDRLSEAISGISRQIKNLY